MTKNHIGAKDFLEIIQESRTNLNFFKQLQNSSDSQENKYY